MRLHVLSLPHRTVTRDNSTCAYTIKCLRFCSMMGALGYPVTLYAPGPEADVTCETVHVTPAPAEPDNPDHLWDASLPHWADYNAATHAALSERYEPGDVVCVIGGAAQQAAVPDGMTCVEFGIGYAGTFSDFRVFESYAWMHTVYGAQQGAYEADGRFYDAVIPNYFDPADFPQGPGGEYALYLGRLIDRKGVRIAQEAAQAAGVPLILAGSGDISDGYGTFVGPVGPAERARLLGGASCLLAPTQYVEPFGGCVAEAQITGTPAVTTDFGAHVENVAHAETGFRCRTLGEFAAAIRACQTLDRDAIRARALSLWSTDVIGPMYADYLHQIDNLNGAGWYSLDPMRIR